MSFEMIDVTRLKPNPRNARTHSKKQIRQISKSIEAFGFAAPIIVDEDDQIIAGHGRALAAKEIGLTTVPAFRVEGLSEAKKRALLLADNRIAENAGWDRAKLAIEIPEIASMLNLEGFDIGLTGFSPVEVDQLAVDFSQISTESDELTPHDSSPVVSAQGDMWLMGSHKLLCGNARDSRSFSVLMDDEKAAMCFADAPYNLAISSILGRGKIKHREFLEASGEQTTEEFSEFLRITLSNTRDVCKPGALVYACMDWRHAADLAIVGRRMFSAHVATCIWVKANGGQGSFYRSQHEEILVFRVGNEPHLNNIELGRNGRNRTNVWHFPGCNSFRAGRLDDLRMHPTVKPVALVAEATRDCTQRGDIVLDPFCGSGTTIVAAEQIGRRGYGIEIDAAYVDSAVRRWQGITRRDATLASTGQTFDDVSIVRNQAGPKLIEFKRSLP